MRVPATRHSGIRHRHQRQPGERRLTSRSRRPRPTTRIDIYRLGYYGGVRRAKMATVRRRGRCRRRSRPASIDARDGSRRLRQLGRSASWTYRPAPTSGIYIAKLTRTDTGGASHIVFIVRDDDAARPICCSRPPTRPGRPTTSTVAAACTATARQQRGHAYSCAGRATKVSYNRPFDTRAHDAPRASCSTPSTRWCAGSRPTATTSSTSPASTPIARRRADRRERSRRCSSRSATTNTGRPGSAPTSKRRATPASTWRSSAATRSTGRRAGRPSIDGTDTPYRTLVSYKETLGSARRSIRSPDVDRHVARPALRPPAADGGRPENALTGTDLDRQLRHRPRSPCRRRWQACASGGTRASRHLTSGVDALPHGTLGYEWDEDSRQRLPSRRPDATVVDDGRRRRKDARLRRDGRHRARRPTT